MSIHDLPREVFAQCIRDPTTCARMRQTCREFCRITGVFTVEMMESYTAPFTRIEYVNFIMSELSIVINGYVSFRRIAACTIQTEFATIKFITTCARCMEMRGGGMVPVRIRPNTAKLDDCVKNHSIVFGDRYNVSYMHSGEIVAHGAPIPPADYSDRLWH